jgi:hypothetical protein
LYGEKSVTQARDIFHLYLLTTQAAIAIPLKNHVQPEKLKKASVKKAIKETRREDRF